jgi:riboflavin kinase/FMN adenylyltransferase
MQLIRGIENIQSIHRPCVASIGNYDGVHRGHQFVLETLLRKSEEMRVPSTIITFQPLAKEFFVPGSVPLLGSVEQRAAQLYSFGVDQVLCIDFNAEFAAYSPKKFVEDILIDGLGVRFLCVGDDFQFGKDRQGNFEFLKSCGLENNFLVTAHDTYSLDGSRISSGRIRVALSEADFDLAERLLGRPYSIIGRVGRGQQLGRTLSFPTANIILDPAQTAVRGVYCVQVNGAANEPVRGVANVGTRPTVDGIENRLEVHLLDFNADIYDAEIEVIFQNKLRDEQKFDSLEALKNQIQTDTEAARKYFQETSP